VFYVIDLDPGDPYWPGDPRPATAEDIEKALKPYGGIHMHRDYVAFEDVVRAFTRGQ